MGKVGKNGGHCVHVFLLCLDIALFKEGGLLAPDRHKLNFTFFVNRTYVCPVNIANMLYMLYEVCILLLLAIKCLISVY